MPLGLDAVFHLGPHSRQIPYAPTIRHLLENIDDDVWALHHRSEHRKLAASFVGFDQLPHAVRHLRPPTETGDESASASSMQRRHKRRVRFAFGENEEVNDSLNNDDKDVTTSEQGNKKKDAESQETKDDEKKDKEEGDDKNGKDEVDDDKEGGGKPLPSLDMMPVSNQGVGNQNVILAVPKGKDKTTIEVVGTPQSSEADKAAKEAEDAAAKNAEAQQAHEAMRKKIEAKQLNKTTWHVRDMERRIEAGLQQAGGQVPLPPVLPPVPKLPPEPALQATQQAPAPGADTSQVRLDAMAGRVDALMAKVDSLKSQGAPPVHPSCMMVWTSLLARYVHEPARRQAASFL